MAFLSDRGRARYLRRALLCWAVLAVPCAQAQEDSRGGESSAAGGVGFGMMIEFSPSRLPVLLPGGRTVNSALVFSFTIRDDETAKKLCRLQPRVHDALHQVLITDPVRLVNKEFRFSDGAAERLRDTVNGAFGSDLVGAAAVKGWTPPIKERNNKSAGAPLSEKIIFRCGATGRIERVR